MKLDKIEKKNYDYEMDPLNLAFREIRVGDLIVQNILNPYKDNEQMQRKGIIVEVKNNISTIEWLYAEPQQTEMRRTTILNLSLRKMIMDGFIKHFPVNP